MQKVPLRVLLLADTHLGFDEPLRPRIVRRRRGPDFWANYRRALEPALRGSGERTVDLVVHGGDLLFRSKVRASLVDRALQPLREIADNGVPVVLVPGNHERSHLPFPLLGIHPGLHLLDRPRTIELEIRGMTVSVSGFPCERERIESSFVGLLERTGGAEARADIRLLCLHQTIEGASVGPSDFVFRQAPDVIRGRDLPSGFAAVLAGHIHRHQVITHDLAGRKLAAPVLYPGSIERTSLAERNETKGFLILEIEPTTNGGRLRRHLFHSLPARPMVSVEIDVSGLTAKDLGQRLDEELSRLDPSSIVHLRVTGKPLGESEALLGAASLRERAPPSMGLSLRLPVTRRRAID